MRRHSDRLLKWQPILFCLSLVFVLGLGIGVEYLPARGQAALIARQTAQSLPILAEVVLPPPQVHPLPAPLNDWHADEQDDYFDAVQPTSVGYLVWSQFPVQVYIQPPEQSDPTGRSLSWYEAVYRALQEWTVYLPLELASTAETANITIWRSAPPLQPLAPATSPDQSALERLPRARAAETHYEIEIHRSGQTATLSHRFTIHLSPNQTESYTQATARHEIGHALGIWGHSPLQTDALYFSQVRNSPPISQRDVNTLKRIYEQPTRLGWQLSQT